MYFDDFSFNDNLNLIAGKSINLNEEGYIYGNMFKDEYTPYKNYSVYKLNASNPEEELKLKIMEETFIINDLNLYLDIHPKDNDIYEIFRKHERLLNKYIGDYEESYGSILLNGKSDTYNWINNPWPWEDDK